jgi:hypothetical protein
MYNVEEAKKRYKGVRWGATKQLPKKDRFFLGGGVARVAVAQIGTDIVGRKIFMFAFENARTSLPWQAGMIIHTMEGCLTLPNYGTHDVSMLPLRIKEATPCQTAWWVGVVLVNP